MMPIKSLFSLLIALCTLMQIASCTKEVTSTPLVKPKPIVQPVKPKKPYFNRLAQDSNYRKGKWYSVSDGAGYGFSTDPLLDTIWFISDSLAGWTGFAKCNNCYTYMQTYFPYTYQIAYKITHPVTKQLVEIRVNCFTSFNDDTITLVKQGNGNDPAFYEQFVKKKD
jgi:hypothetical protein